MSGSCGPPRALRGNWCGWETGCWRGRGARSSRRRICLKRGGLLEEQAPVRAPGLAAFGGLRAEDEPWLAECFVPPADFGLMAGMGSIAVFGPPGSGKSALREMLIERCRAPSGSQRCCLIARWQPNPLVLGPDAGFRSVPGQVNNVFDVCAMAILEYVVAHPSVWSGAPRWARNLLTWFVHRFMQGDAAGRAAYLLEQEGGPGPSTVQGLLEAEVTQDLVPPHNWPQVAAELSKALTRLGLEGVWVVVDGLEPWVETQFDRVVSSLSAFFSTLPLFEQAAFAYKAFLPSVLQSDLAAAAGVERGRIQPYWLAWREEQLVEMVERRLAFALGRSRFTLHELCSAEGLLEWLRRGGGNRPRAWLELIRPLVTRYISEQRHRPIGMDEWVELRRRTPPRLFLDEMNRRVVVGGREVGIEEMTSGGYRIFCYLYKNAGRVVPWDELYYRGYRGLEHVPRAVGDEGYEAPASYENVLYSRISDLRKAIEPDPRDPLYLDTVRGVGVVLRLRW
ncbi:MAG TPA: winged helix family transcriptional regulator [Anaerolineae bacterium]|nr:winged helix family transcriptional regulator [Anaerolineae bacterium]